jgi:hypothetical protein
VTHVRLVRPLLAGLFLFAAFAAPAKDAPPSPLIGPPVHYVSKQGEDYRLSAAHPRDAAGKAVAGLPATRIAVPDEEGGWDDGEAAELPSMALDIPAALRDRMQLFHADALGWIAVPRGWRVQRTAVGMDGTTVFSFVAPQGPSAGWMSLTEIPACLGCIYEAAQGLFPGAHKQLDELMESRSPEPVLDPKPEKLERLDRCTVRVDYTPPQSPQARLLAIYQQQGDPSFSELTVAVPSELAAYADYALAAFRHGHDACGTAR